MNFLDESKNPRMKKINLEVDKYAKGGLRVLFHGPSGCGKEVLAKRYSDKFRETHSPDAPFYSHNCAAICENLAEFELFGIEKGAVPNVKEKPGLFELANHGVLFLDEIGDLSPEIQPKLLLALDPGTACARRIGGKDQYSTANVTVIAATEKSLESIRKPLLNRFHDIIEVPGLEDRQDDVRDLIDFCFRKALLKREVDLPIILKMLKIPDSSIENLCKNKNRMFNHKRIRKLADSVSSVFEQYVLKNSWPDNIRGLQNVLDCAVILLDNKDMSTEDEFIEALKKKFEEKIYYRSQSAQKVSADKVSDKNLPVVVDNELLAKVRLAIEGSDEIVQKIIVDFLSKMNDIPFTQKELRTCLQEKDIDLGVRTVQKILRDLCNMKVIHMKSAGRNTHYHLTQWEELSVRRPIHRIDFLPLPHDIVRPDGYTRDIMKLKNYLHRCRIVYVTGDIDKIEKTRCVLTLGKELEVERLVGYYPFGEMGISRLLQIFHEEILKQGIKGAPPLITDSNSDSILWTRTLADSVKILFSKEELPLLILDNIELLADSSDQKALYELIECWNNICFLLVGEKPDSLFSETPTYEIMTYKYYPRPIDTSEISLSKDLVELTERLAENSHDNWALRRIQEDWTYGRVRNDQAKTHPDLVPYEDLPESEKEFDREAAMEALKAIIVLGYRIEKP